jgi:catechol 2,3-dioxygenase-like lactoylglutathione lyase family enzyme
MTTINGIAEAALYVADLDRASRFYEDVLGLPLTASFDDARFLQTGRHSTLILFNAEGIRRRKSAIPSHGAEGEGHVALAVPSREIEDWRERLVSHGVTIEHDQLWSYGSRSLYFRDPDNNSLELISDDHYPLNYQQHVASDSND